MGARPWEVRPPFAVIRIGGRRTRRGEAPPHPKGGTHKTPTHSTLPPDHQPRAWIRPPLVLVVGRAGLPRGSPQERECGGTGWGPPKRKKPRTHARHTHLGGCPISRTVGAALMGDTHTSMRARARATSKWHGTRRKSMEPTRPGLSQVVRPTRLGPNGDPFPSLEGATLGGP